MAGRSDAALSLLGTLPQEMDCLFSRVCPQNKEEHYSIILVLYDLGFMLGCEEHYSIILVYIIPVLCLDVKLYVLPLTYVILHV